MYIVFKAASQAHIRHLLSGPSWHVYKYPEPFYALTYGNNARLVQAPIFCLLFKLVPY